MTKNETIKWLNDFQMSVNTLIEGNYLQFTALIWNVDESSSKLTDKIDTVGDNAFPYLDMEFFWSDNELHTKVHIKQNQRLSYLEKCSTHPSTVFKAIPRGVFKRLAKLTTKTPKNANITLNQLYQRHTKTLKSANLNPPKYQSINEVSKETETRKKLKETKLETSYRCKTLRNIFFCISYSNSWLIPIHKVFSNI